MKNCYGFQKCSYFVYSDKYKNPKGIKSTVYCKLFGFDKFDPATGKPLKGNNADGVGNCYTRVTPGGGMIWLWIVLGLGLSGGAVFISLKCKNKKQEEEGGEVDCHTMLI